VRTHPATPPLRPDADPRRSAEYAARLAGAQTAKEVMSVHREFADLRQQRSMRQEISDLVHAPKGSDVARARDKLGIMLILAGLFGLPLLFGLVIAVGAVIGAIF